MTGNRMKHISYLNLAVILNLVEIKLGYVRTMQNAFCMTREVHVTLCKHTVIISHVKIKFAQYEPYNNILQVFSISVHWYVLFSSRIIYRFLHTMFTFFKDNQTGVIVHIGKPCNIINKPHCPFFMCSLKDNLSLNLFISNLKYDLFDCLSVLLFLVRISLYWKIMYNK